VLTEESLTAGPLRSAGITPPHRYCRPVRLPLAVGRFPGVTGYTAYLAPVISARDEEGLSSCSARPCHHAVDNHPVGVSHRISLIAMIHAAFAKSLPARPPRLKVSRPPLVRLRYGLVTRRHPFDGVVGRLQNHGFPTDPATQATGLRLLPRWDCLPQNAPAFAGRTMTSLERGQCGDRVNLSHSSSIADDSAGNRRSPPQAATARWGQCCALRPFETDV
jgi:hypothetical protein